MDISLRGYQERMISDIRSQYATGFRSPLLVAPTGSGKTLLFSFIAMSAAAKGRRTLILVHRRELLHQTSRTLDSLGVSHGLIAAGIAFERTRNVQVASVQTLVRRMSKLPWQPNLIVVDECFPSGTLVDGKPIETIRDDDTVNSFDHETQRIERRRVVRVFKSKPAALVVVIFKDGSELRCTAGHPFFVEGIGYVEAQKLTRNSEVLELQELRQNRGDCDELSTRQDEKSGLGALLNGVRKGISQKDELENGSQDKQEVCVQADDGKKSNEVGNIQIENATDSRRYGPQTEGSRWKRDREYGSAGQDDRPSESALPRHRIGIHFPDENSKGDGVSDSLQNRYCDPESPYCDRDRRDVACVDSQTEGGCEERLALTRKGVDRVEVLEQGGDDEWRDVCPGGFVYNIEVEANHNYFADGILVHNCHHATGKTTWGKILHRYNAGPRDGEAIDECRGAHVLGVTATPERLDGQGLGVLAGGFFDSMVIGPAVRELVAEGYLSQPVVYAPPTPDLSGLRSQAGDYAKAEAAASVDKPTITGSAVEHYRRHCNGAPALAFCVTVAHADHVAQTFGRAGYQAASIDGTLDGGTRASRIDDLANGRLNVLTSCEIVSEGTDIPVVACAILLRPTQSLGLYLQQAGRALRPYPGKERATILDHVGNCRRHGLPDDDREWDLNASKRSKRERDTEATLPIRQCEMCYHIYRPAPTCPKCGHANVRPAARPEEVPGELEKVTAAKPEEERKRAEAKFLEELRELRELRELGRRRGYKPGWAIHIWNARKKRRAG